jgi:hypothetical protein
MSDTEFWEQWTGSTARPVECVKRRSRIRKENGRAWITYRDQINGADVVVDMPDNAPTKSCQQDRHDACPHRLGGPQEGGVALRITLPGFIWRCGCPCHRDPFRVGRLF